MSIRKFILCRLIIAVAYVKSTEGQICQTPSSSIGQCIEFRSCESFFNMHQRNWVTPDELDLIRKSWCPAVNGVHKICCPTPTENIELSRHPNIDLITLEQCGKTIGDKIAFGSLTQPFEFPWMAMLRRLLLNNETLFYCGGTLISNRYVLTAAHCLRTIVGEIPLHSVVLGEHDTNTNPDCSDNDCADPVQEIPVERSIPHPNFSFSSAQHDIGLIRLQRVVKFSDSVMPICIPYTDSLQTKDFHNLIVLGWGKTEQGRLSNVLLKAKLNITSNSDCSAVYQTHNQRLQINENVLCAVNDVSDTCAGDSGGPAIFLAQTALGPRSFQYGIVSVGARICGKSNNIPGAYTSVTSYVQWILDNISK